MPISPDIEQQLSIQLENWLDRSEGLLDESLVFVGSLVNSGDPEVLQILTELLQSDGKAVGILKNISPQGLLDALKDPLLPKDDETFYDSEYYELIRRIFEKFDDILPAVKVTE